MSATFLSSLIMFAITGVYMLSTAEIGKDLVIKGCVGGTVILNALYFYYFAAHAELDSTARAELRAASAFEWPLRVWNQTVLFGLWFALQWGFRGLGIALIVLYCGYILWDVIVWKHVTDHTLCAYDILGVIVAIAFLWIHARLAAEPAAGKDSNELYFFAGVITLLYLMMALSGVKYGVKTLGFNPFSAQHMARSVRR